MSEDYSPNPGIGPDEPMATTLLSQRDLGLQVPINFKTEPGVSLTAACFAKQIYEDDALADCFSNLLAVGFRRFEIDLYWDQNRKLWSFCPVEIPPAIAASANLPSIGTIDVSSGIATFTSGTESTGTLNQSRSQSDIKARQLDRTLLSQSSTTTSLSTTVSLAEVSPTVSAPPETPDRRVVNVGPFSCTTSISISNFTSQLHDYITKTQNTLGAHLIYVFFNIHAISTATSPEQPAPKPSTLPESTELIGNIFSGNLSAYIYTPEELISDRLDLNKSWYFEVEKGYEPLVGYYQIDIDEEKVASTTDGWPSEGYIEFSQGKRLLLGWGATDIQMEEYNFSEDAETIFDIGYLGQPQKGVRASADGEITNGCFLANGTIELSQSNSSWANSYSISNFNYPTSSSADLKPLLSLIQNLTYCGISTNLNHTLLDATANQDYIPYLNYTEATLWTWAPNQPLNDSTSGDATESNGKKALYRCASTSPVTGRWFVADCNTKYPAACRSPGHPYNWTLTSNYVSYSSAEKACPKGYEFAAPRTALENAYLTKKIRDGGQEQKGNVWVEFNSIDTEDCWVAGGRNTRCPYANDQDADDMRRRYILVPTIAAVLVLVITLSTLFIKCAGARKSKKRGRSRKLKAHNGFVYEGVPS